MKVVPAKPVLMGLLVLLCATSLTLWSGRPNRAAARSMHLESEAAWTGDGEMELWIRWRWEPPAEGQSPGGRAHLLAVSFETRELLFVLEEAPAGVGANGEPLGRLQRLAGPNGARRLFVVPEGEDGYVRVRLRPRDEQAELRPDAIQVHLVFEHPGSQIWRLSPLLPARPKWTAATGDYAPRRES